jgi:hypothetical protein
LKAKVPIQLPHPAGRRGRGRGALRSQARRLARARIPPRAQAAPKGRSYDPGAPAGRGVRRHGREVVDIRERGG